MCNFIALTRCCKLMFFTFNICCYIAKFNKANRIPNILRGTWQPHAAFRENFYHSRSAFQRRSYVPNLKYLAQAVLKIWSVICENFRGHVQSYFRNENENGNYRTIAFSSASTKTRTITNEKTKTKNLGANHTAVFCHPALAQQREHNLASSFRTEQ